MSVSTCLPSRFSMVEVASLLCVCCVYMFNSLVADSIYIYIYQWMIRYFMFRIRDRKSSIEPSMELVPKILPLKHCSSLFRIWSLTFWYLCRCVTVSTRIKTKQMLYVFYYFRFLDSQHLFCLLFWLVQPFSCLRLSVWEYETERIYLRVCVQNATFSKLN